MHKRFLTATIALFTASYSVFGTTVFFEDFESYAPGSNLIGQGGWEDGFPPGSVITVNPGTFLATQVMDGRAPTGLGREHVAEHSAPILPAGVTTVTFDAFAPPLNSTHNQEVSVDTFGPGVGDRVRWGIDRTAPLNGWSFGPGGANGNFAVPGGINQPVKFGIVLDGVNHEVYGLYDFMGGSGWTQTPHYPLSPERLSTLNAIHIYVDHRDVGSYNGIEVDNILVNAAFSKWNIDASGNWSDDGNWENGAPSAPGALANFTDAITAPRIITLDSPKTVGVVNFDNSNRYTITGASLLTLNVVTGSASINIVSGSHTIACPVQLAKNTVVTVTPPASTLTVSGDFSAASGVTLTKAGAGQLEVKHVRADRLTISTGKVNVLPDGTDAGTSKVGVLTIAGGIDTWTSTLDLHNNSLVVDYSGATPLSTIQNQIKSGFNLGNWNGSGITSSAAAATIASPHRTGLGYAEAPDLYSSFPATFDGQTVDATSILIRYTWAGDANLDRSVNLADFAVFTAFFNSFGPWFRGDFNYDNLVNIADFAILTSNFGASPPVGSLELPHATDDMVRAVPEPSIWLMMSTWLVVALRHRRERASATTLQTLD